MDIMREMPENNEIDSEISSENSDYVKGKKLLGLIGSNHKAEFTLRQVPAKLPLEKIIQSSISSSSINSRRNAQIQEYNFEHINR
jgi:hypothetical protein